MQFFDWWDRKTRLISSTYIRSSSLVRTFDQTAFLFASTPLYSTDQIDRRLPFIRSLFFQLDPFHLIRGQGGASANPGSNHGPIPPIPYVHVSTSLFIGCWRARPQPLLTLTFFFLRRLSPIPGSASNTAGTTASSPCTTARITLRTTTPRDATNASHDGRASSYVSTPYGPTRPTLPPTWRPTTHDAPIPATTPRTPIPHATRWTTALRKRPTHVASHEARIWITPIRTSATRTRS